MGSLVAALFIHNRPSVTSSSALFGLLGTTLSALIRNWKFYTKKVFLFLSEWFILFRFNCPVYRFNPFPGCSLLLWWHFCWSCQLISCLGWHHMLTPFQTSEDSYLASFLALCFFSSLSQGKLLKVKEVYLTMELNMLSECSKSWTCLSLGVFFWSSLVFCELLMVFMLAVCHFIYWFTTIITLHLLFSSFSASSSCTVFLDWL